MMNNTLGDKPTEGIKMDKYEQEIFMFCGELLTKMLHKYRQGKKEHEGQDPTGLDIPFEISQEIMDIIIYHQMFKVNKRVEDE